MQQEGVSKWHTLEELIVLVVIYYVIYKCPKFR